jgi:hypothetical protein
MESKSAKFFEAFKQNPQQFIPLIIASKIEFNKSVLITLIVILLIAVRVVIRLFISPGGRKKLASASKTSPLGRARTRKETD